MPLRLKCLNCGRYLTLSDNDTGQTIVCTACGMRFQFDPALLSPLKLAAEISAVPIVNPTIKPPNWPSPKADPIQGPPTRAARRFLTVTASIALVCILIVPAGIWWSIELLLAKRSPIAATAPHTIYVAIPPPVTVHPNQISHATSQPAGTVIVHETLRAAPPVPTVAPPAPAPVPAATPPVVQQESKPAARFHPINSAGATDSDVDDAIGQSIARGVSFLLTQFSHGHLAAASTNSETAGMDALAVYALLQAGEAVHDLRLQENSPLVDEMLKSLKSFPMDREITVYSRSLRAAALSVYHRPADKIVLHADANWLMHADVAGGFSYDPIAVVDGLPHAFDLRWDNSNSQYGALGVWAASEAGVEVPNSFWELVQRHWLSCQLPDGEWGYAPYTDTGRLSMTVAGLTTLFVTEDQLDVRKVVTTLGHEPFTPSITRALNWLEAGDNSIDLPQGAFRTYNLFGLERAALASGFKYFGNHDWYRELASDQLKNQSSVGAWSGSDPIVDTAYTLLFLSRGRHPIFMNKMRFDGYWANRPRDIANLCRYAAQKLERPVNWQVVSLKSDWPDWMDSPILYIASHQSIKLSDDDCNKLRQFSLNGGLIFTHADGDSAKFNTFVTALSKRLFPDDALADLPADHPIYSALYKVKPQPRLQGVSNGSRLLLVHSPTDLNKAWQMHDEVEHPNQFQMGMNIFIYAAGKNNLRNKLKTPYVPQPTITPVLTTTLAELQYLGKWNPEPAALPRFSRLFELQTGVEVDPRPIDPTELDVAAMPFAHLTGVDEVHLTPPQMLKIHDYVQNGGTLVIDACGGSTAFVKSMLVDILPHCFPRETLATVKSDDPILIGTGEGMAPVGLHLRPYQADINSALTAPIEGFIAGKGRVIFSNIDITTGLLGTNTWPINGYEPETAIGLMRNILLFTLENRDAPPAMPATPNTKD